MPIVNGSYVPYNLNLTNGSNGMSSAIHFMTLTPILTPWLVVLFIAGLYFVTFYALKEDSSRWKFTTITFVPMFVSLIFGLIGWVPATVPASTLSIFILTTLIVVATSG